MGCGEGRSSIRWSASLEAIPRPLWRLPITAGSARAGGRGAGASRKQQRGTYVSKQLGVPGGPKREATLLGMDVGHGLTKLLGPTSRCGIKRKALHVFNHFACEAKS